MLRKWEWRGKNRMHWMVLVEHLLGFVRALIKTVLAFGSSHSGDHFSWSIFILMLVLSFIAEIINIRFEYVFQKQRVIRIQIFLCTYREKQLLQVIEAWEGKWLLGFECCLPNPNLHPLSLEYSRCCWECLPCRGWVPGIPPGHSDLNTRTLHLQQAQAQLNFPNCAFKANLIYFL